MKNNTYWKDTQKSTVTPNTKPVDSPILIIGAGFAGVSTAYHLLQNLQHLDMKPSDILIADNGQEHASYHRNAGHILHGMGENYQTFSAVHGKDNAIKLLNLSQHYTQNIRRVIEKEKIDCDYKLGNYYIIPKTDHEEQELIASREKMIDDEIYVNEKSGLRHLGFNTDRTGIHCHVSASAHPASFRNGLLQVCKNKGLIYSSGVGVKSVDEKSVDNVVVTWHNGQVTNHNIVVVTSNAYTKLISGVESLGNRIEPFKGQIIVSKPVKIKINNLIFSTDHGYIYGHFLPDNRVLIGCWRNNVAGGEVGKTDLSVNKETELGLIETAEELFNFDCKWEYSWSGIMASTDTGLPMVGTVKGCNLIYTATGFNGYGFGFAFGMAKDLVDIIIGKDMTNKMNVLGLLRP